MRKVFLSALAAFTLAIVGCGSAKPDKFVGQWKMDVNGAPATANFESGGAMTIKIDVKAFQSLQVNVTGKWRDEGDKLFITVADATATNFPPQLKGHETEFTEQMKKSMEIGKEESGTVKWEGADKFTITRDGNSSAFTRIKS